MTRITIADLSPRQTVSRKEQGRIFGHRRSFFRPTLEVLEERQLLSATAFSNLMNVPVQFNLLPNGHLQEKMGNVQSDLGIVQGLYQGKDTAGHQVAFDVVNNILREFVPKKSWVTIGTAGQVVQNGSGNVFFTQGSTLYVATGVPGVKLPVLGGVSGLGNAGSQAVVQVGPCLTANLTASLGGSSGASLSFTNVQLNLGGFASSFLGQAIADLQAFTRPLRPLADDLEMPFIAGSNFTTLWVMQQLGYGQAAGYARTFADTVHAVNALTAPAAGTTSWVNLGSFTAQVQSPTQLVTVSSTLASTAQIDSQLGSLAPAFAQLRSIPGLRLAIDDPRQLLSLVTGQASTLFTYTLSVPKAISAIVQQQLTAIPVSPVTLTEVDLYANLGVSVSAQATFGFDTTGYQSGNLAKGFFIQNASLNASLTAGLSGLLNEADLAGYQITGAVTGTVTAGLHGANGSNKVYANQFATGGLVFSPPNWNSTIQTQFLGPDKMLSLAIHQFGPYLKNLVGTDAQIAANILNGKGVTVDDIAVALGTVYGIPPQTTTGILKGLNKTANEVAGALESAYNATAGQVASDLSKANYALQDIAGALSGIYHEGYTQIAATLLANANSGINAIAYALWHAPIGINSPGLAAALYNGITHDYSQIAGALASGAGRAIGGVAYDLWHAPIGINSPGLAAALYNGITHDYSQIAGALASGAGRAIGGVAYDLWHAPIGIDSPGLAAALYNGITHDYSQIAGALASGAGRAIGGVAYDLWHAPIGIDSPGLAAALYNGITHDYSQIAGALASGAGRAIGGVAYDLWHAPIGIDSPGLAAALYNGITHDYSQIAGALASGAGRAIGGVAYDLWHALIGIDSPGLAAALYNGITHDYSQIAGALASGAGRAIGGVAYDLWHAPIGIDSPGLAAALYNGITHDYSQIAGALASGAGRDAGGVAYDLWHAPVGITAGTLVGVLESVFSLNLVSAWAIVNGL